MPRRVFADDPESLRFGGEVESLPLWGQPVPFQQGSDTSEAAAKILEQGAADILRARVLRAFEAAGARGLTADECGEAIGATPFACRPRATELLQAGLLRRTSMRRLNASGMSARVLVAAS